MNAFDALTSRTSINFYDTEKAVSKEDLLEILNYAQEAPTAYNIQHTRYMVVTDAAAQIDQVFAHLGRAPCGSGCC